MFRQAFGWLRTSWLEPQAEEEPRISRRKRMTADRSVLICSFRLIRGSSADLVQFEPSDALAIRLS